MEVSSASLFVGRGITYFFRLLVTRVFDYSPWKEKYNLLYGGAMSSIEYQGDPQFRSWLERIIEFKVHEELARERERLFRESLAIISVREKDPLAESIATHLGK